MSNLKAILLIAISVSITTCIAGQVKTQIRHIAEREGLSYRWTFDIVQDHKGFMWFATYNGLNRYDGESFVTYKHSDADTSSLSTSVTMHVAEDSDGHIWTYGQDLIYNRLDPATGKCVRTNRYLRNDTLVNGIMYNMRHFAPLTNGEFMILVQGKSLGDCSLWSYDQGKNAFIHVVDIPARGGEVNYFSEYTDDKLWVWGLGLGYYLVDLNTRTVEHFPIENLSGEVRLDVVLPMDENRDLWFPSWDKAGSGQPHLVNYHLPDNIDLEKIERFRHDNRSGIWMNYGNDSMIYLNTLSGEFDFYYDPFFGESMDYRSMQRFYVDDEDACWYGYFYGIARVVNLPPLFTRYLADSEMSDHPGPDKFSAREILQCGPDKVIVRGNDFSFYIIDVATNEVKELNRTPDESIDQIIPTGVHSSFIGTDGYLWTSQLNWLVRTDISTGIYTVFHGNEYSDKNYPRIFEDNSGQIWWCSGSGILKFDRETAVMSPVEIGMELNTTGLSFMYGSHDKAEDKIYGTYDRGLYVIDCTDNSASLVETFSENETDYLITAITKWNGELWLATDKGLVRYDPETGRRKIYHQADGLPSDIVYSALGSGDELWLATHSGLCQFDYENEKMTTYYREQGLPNNEFNRWSYCKLDDGYLMFGGINGVIGFDPGDFSFPDKQLGKLNLLNISKYNQKEDQLEVIVDNPFADVGHVTIAPYERTLTFEYILSIYEKPGGNQYFHYLEGLERDWIEDGDQNEVRYIQVPPGNYTFRAKARGPTKISATNEIAIPITVQQYWYLRWWAFVIYAIMAAVAVTILYRFQLSRKLERQEANRIKELEEVKTRLYTNITHEFRTPLTVMLGMNQAINEYAEKGDLDKVHHSTEMIDRNANNLLDLVNQMLDLSKLESGMLDVHNRPGDMIAYLKYRLEAFQTYAAEKNIEIGFFSELDELQMDFDPDRVSHIINNLVSNAIKFTPEGGSIEVTASKVKNNHNNDFLELKVKDTGVGIEEDKIKHIFDRFYQADHTSLKKGEGTGIGLSLVNEMVKLLGGTISVDSAPGKGTEFSVMLPAYSSTSVKADKISALATTASDSVAEEVDVIESISGYEKELPLVLIVEDNPDVMHYIGISIDHSYRTTTANNGREGIAKAIELIPDVVISDVMMPDTDGYQLCETLKKDERTSHIPVILLTAKTDQVSKVTGLEHGADAYLSKPFHQQELLIRLKNLLALRAEFQRRYSATDYSEPDQGPSNPEDAFIRKVRVAIADHLEDDDFDVAKLCKLLLVSRAQLHRKLTALTGESTSQLIRTVQLDKAKALLTEGQLSVSEVAYRTGFKTQAHFSRVFSESEGVAPSDYRRNQGA